MKYEKKDEKVISNNIGYPYDVIPKGYPNKVSDNKIDETINKVLNNLKGNAGIESVVTRDTAFINLGLNELNNRQNRKQSRIAFWISTLSLLLSGAAFIISMLALQSSREDTIMLHKNLDELKNISQALNK
ncbi:MAG: hypothetical protein JW816_00640 [Candidatus Buchananbacteria bacterium]|nr:hypothetical protein [Candidatus Buchananbacteria bacterium]